MPPVKIAAPPPPAAQARVTVAEVRAGAAVASSIPALRAEVVRLADALESVLDEMERR